jgi:hypothetical protein
VHQFNKESGRAADLVAELHACYSEIDATPPDAHRQLPQTGAHSKSVKRDAEIRAM